MGAWGWVKKKAKKVGKGIHKAVDKGVDALDKVTDNKAFEVSANAIGSVYGVPNAGTLTRKVVDATQDVMDGNFNNALQLATERHPGLIDKPSVTGSFDPVDYIDKFNAGVTTQIPKQMMSNNGISGLNIHEYLGQEFLNNADVGAYKFKALNPLLNQITDRNVYDLFNF